VTGPLVTVTWTGVDGTVWNLTDLASPVTLTGGIGGLHLPSFEQQWTATAHIDGRRHRTVTIDGRDVALRVHVGDVGNPPYRTGLEWLELDARWWAGFSTTQPGTLTVSTARGARSLRARLGEAPDPVFPTDPSVRGRQVYDLILSAEDAYWSGPDIVVPFDWAATGTDPFFGGTGGGGYGPPFVIVGASQLATASITNPGDVEAWPRYTLVSPFESAVIGIGDNVITLPFGADVGNEIHIDTDPRRLTIVNEAGDNLWPLLGSAPDPLFAPIPPGEAVHLSIQMESAGAGASVIAALTPRYRRALS
jgi:hypothetical protein